jgi:hypothetical protein
MKSYVTVLLLFFAVLICAGFALGNYQQHRVDSFFRELVALQPGKSSFEDVQKLAVQYGAKSSGIQSNTPCTAQDCAVTFTFTNWIFNHLHRNRAISLTAGLFVKDGLLTSKEINFSIASHSGNDDYLYVLFDRSRVEGNSGYRVHYQRINAQGVAHFVEAELGSNAPDKLKSGAYSINLGCISRTVGCNSQHDVVPEVWR